MARARGRNGRFTAERTTEETRTRRVTERVTFADDDTIGIPAVAWDGLPVDATLELAPGWDPGPVHPPSGYWAQRKTQQDQALTLLAVWDASAPEGERVPGWLIRQAVTILRAGPHASPLELTLGRSC